MCSTSHNCRGDCCKLKCSLEILLNKPQLNIRKLIKDMTMPYKDDSDGPWGSGKKKDKNSNGNKSPWGGNSGNNGSGPGQGDTGIPEIDQIVKKVKKDLKEFLWVVEADLQVVVDLAEEARLILLKVHYHLY